MTADWARVLAARDGAPLISRRAAAHLARRELARAQYQETVTARILHWLGRLVGRVASAAGSLPGGLWSTVVLLTALVLVIAAVVFWIRPAGPSRLAGRAVLSGARLSAHDHRVLAARHAAGGDYSAAIIEAMRALAVGIEERGLLAARPGRTADELAAQVGQVVPDLAAELAAMALLFDSVRYGARAGTPEGYDRIRSLDERVAATRAVVVDVSSAAGQHTAAPS